MRDMKATLSAIEKLQKKFHTKKILTMVEISAILKITPRNSRRYLKQLGSLTSYNCNGRFYTLRSIAVFNEFGIWSWNSTHFSRHGNLRETFIFLVERSEHGLNGVEAGDILGLDPRSFLSHFRNEPLLCRQKFNRRNVYFSADPGILKKQLIKHERRDLTPELADATAVTVLVEKIKHPDLDIRALTKAVSAKGVKVPLEMIRCFFEKHGLLKKS